MSKIGAKIVKIILVIGLFIYLQYYDIQRGAFGFSTVISGLTLASAVYFLISLFVMMVDLFRNYVIAIIVTLVLAFFLLFKLDEVIAATPLTDETAAIIMSVVALICLARDFSFIRGQLLAPKTAKERPSCDDGENDGSFSTLPVPVKDGRQVLKENPEFMMELSKELEKRKRHKPTYEELIDYIDNEAFHLKSAEEIQQEVDELTEQIKEQVRTENEQKRKQTE